MHRTVESQLCTVIECTLISSIHQHLSGRGRIGHEDAIALVYQPRGEGDCAGAVEALVFRASAHRYLDALDLAFADASRALELSPLHPEALLERGIFARIQGRKNAARRDWLNLLKYYEGTPAGDAAQRNLELLDVSAE